MEITATKATFPKYPAYKDSGVKWLGEIPEGWEVLPGLSFITEGKDKNKGMKRKSVLSLSYGNIREKADEELTGLVPESFETYQLVNKGDLIFRPTDLQNDKVSLRSSISNYEGIITSAYLNLRIKQKASAKFYHYFFRAIDNNKIIYGLGSGLRQNISYLDFRRFLFPFPPKQEQTAIANFLDDKTAKIDRAIAQKEQLIALLKERKQIIIQDAVTKGLDPNVKLKDSGVEWIGEIPEGWEVKKLKNLGNIISGYAFPSDGFKSEGIRVLKIANIQTMNIDWSDESYVDEKYYEKLPQFQIKEGDLVFALTRPIISTGIKATIVPPNSEKILLNQRNSVLKPKNPKHKHWLYFVILDSGFRQEFNNQIDFTGQQPNISPIDIGNLKIPLPPVAELELIVENVELAMSKIDQAISLQQTQIEKLKEYKATLIDSAVTGKIKVS
ncbi:restriction endonuclease subunit S [Cyclobacterium xiamenense]|uniref:restriction endonuclease subunit S n=1 Tax=Cyclobacterium xiamenense TaxID=1297121 RepID=UPI0012BA2F65|nr:restriction endonuclease subunit S [Cyclobacterium xiamenense]